MPLTFGVIADAQYADAEPSNNRYYRHSLEKLRAAVEVFNRSDIEFVLNFGDLIDRNFEDWKPALAELDRLKMPVYHLAGNHDFAGATDAQKLAVYEMLKLSPRYSSFARDGWRFVLLDGNDLSLHAPLADEGKRELAALQQHPEKLSNSQEYNGALSRAQLEWLDETLTAAERAGERVLLCCHFPILSAHPLAWLWNAEAVRSIIAAHSAVIAYFSGHDHDGDYLCDGGVHYLTFQGMVETEHKNAFAIVRLDEDRIGIEGFGRQESRDLNMLT